MLRDKYTLTVASEAHISEAQSALKGQNKPCALRWGWRAADIWSDDYDAQEEIMFLHHSLNLS